MVIFNSTQMCVTTTIVTSILGYYTTAHSWVMTDTVTAHLTSSPVDTKLSVGNIVTILDNPAGVIVMPLIVGGAPSCSTLAATPSSIKQKLNITTSYIGQHTCTHT